MGDGPTPLSRHPAWASVLQEGLRHRAVILEAVEDGRTPRDLGPWPEVRSLLFGRFLVSLPYLNYGGPIADDGQIALALVHHAVALADSSRVDYLELRNVQGIEHPPCRTARRPKLIWSAPSPAPPKSLGEPLSEGPQSGPQRSESRPDHRVGRPRSPGLPRRFQPQYASFRHAVLRQASFRVDLLRHFPDRAEICVIRSGITPIASALLLHGKGVTEVPSASSLREYNSTCCNMLMYHNLIERSDLARSNGIRLRPINARWRDLSVQEAMGSRARIHRLAIPCQERQGCGSAA